MADESKVDLGDAAYTTAAFGSMFAPGAGVADVMGYAPDPFNPGQMSPSFSENVDQGNYIDAGIQTLGLAGDALYAAAPFTAGIAALPAAGLKTLQAGAKTLRGARTAADLPKSTGLLGGDKPQRFYHGTGAAYKEFDPDAPYTFVADSPATSDFYAIDGDSPNTRPVYLKDVNFFDVDNPNHLKQLRESDFYKGNKTELDTFASREQKDFVGAVEAGNYETIEDSGVVDWIRSQGFDGFTTYEMAGKNYAVFDVSNIVPGVAKKAKGGIVSLLDVARNTGRGPRGVASLAPIARNMNRSMLS